MLKAYKYRLYPTEPQKLNIEKHIGCSRFVHNHMLALHKELYENHNEKWNKYEYIKKLVPLKKTEEYSWLKEVNSQTLQQSILNLDSAFQNMFQKHAKFPKFKKKNKSKNSFHVPQNVSVFFDEKLVFLPKFKEGISCIFHRRFDGNIRNATISRTKTKKKVLKIGRFEPSSKLCSVCGYKNKELTLKDRMWKCPECGTEHDRDINAAVNIRNIGLSTAGTAGFQACGESVSLVFSKAVLCEAGSPHFKTVSQV
jgi:transposase